MNLMSAIENVTKPEALLVALLGFAMVFVVMAVLVGVLYLFNLVFKLKFLKEKEVAPNVDQLDDVCNDDEQEVVAAITAAISLVLSNEANTATASVGTPAFRIKSIKRVN